MTQPSASAIARALACPGSLVLPQHSYDTEAAAEGTERHAADETAIDLGDAADVLPPEVMALIRPGDQMTTERSFAYDVPTDTARALGHGRQAYKGLAPFEIPGTLDLLIRGNGRAIVVDKKGFERVGPAATNEQTMTYALMVARACNLPEVTVVIYYELGKPDIATITELDLDAHAARLKQMQLDAALARANPAGYLRIGKHCKYCPAFLSCPKQHALALEISSADTAMQVETRIPFEDDQAAADAFDLLARIKMLTTRISAALYARAAARPIPLHNGRILGPVKKQGNEKLDGDVVYAVLREQHGQGIADAAVVRQATKKRLKEALGFACGKGEVAKLERAALDEVRKRGGVTQGEKVAIEEYEPEQMKAAGGT